MTARYRKSGFTLVEILIVVVILGILAAIVIPQFSSASESARASSLKSTLQTIRSQLELFQVQHNGAYPEAPANGADGGMPTWQIMTTAHRIASTAGLADGVAAWGDVSTDTEGGNLNLGPYLQKFPANPFAGGSSTWTDHWYYDDATGRIAANISWTDTDGRRVDLGMEDLNDFANANPFE